MVGQVERLGPKLNALGFPERDVFHKGKIEVGQAGTNDGVAPQVAIESRIRQSKRAGVEVEVRSPQFCALCNTRTTFRDTFHRIGAKARKQIRTIPYLPAAGSVARTI